MSLSGEFLNSFKPIPVPVKTKQDVANWFMSIMTNAQKNGHQRLTIKMPKEFRYSFTVNTFLDMIFNFLTEMNFTKMIQDPFWSYIPRTFYYIKSETSYQYNEEYKRDTFCLAHQNPEGICVVF